MMTPDSDTISDHKQRHHWKHAHDHDRPAVARRDTAAASEAAVEAAASAAAATAADNTNQGCGTSNKGSSECSSTRTKSQPINTKKQTKFHSASTLRTIHASTTTSRPTTIPRSAFPKYVRYTYVKNRVLPMYVLSGFSYRFSYYYSYNFFYGPGSSVAAGF